MEKEMLLEVFQTTKKLSGIDPSKPGNMKAVLVDDTAFDIYITGLAESMESKKDRSDFKILAENTRISLLENSMFQINPYESLTLPILRVFYPKLVAKEAVTVSPMDKPETIKAFIKAKFSQSNDSTLYNAPVTGKDISGGPSIGTPIAAAIPVPSNNYNILAIASLTKDQAHLERDFQITAASMDGTNFVNISVIPAVEGHFSQSVTIGAETDVISGKVDYLEGTVDISNTTGKIISVKYEVTCS